MPTSGLSGAPPETIALIRPPNFFESLGLSVAPRNRFIGRSDRRPPPAALRPPIATALSSRKLAKLPCFSTCLTMRVRSTSNRRGTTTMIVGRTSSMFEASFSSPSA